MSVDITVQGTYKAYQPPQRATVRLRVGLEGPKKDAVFAGVSTAANAVSNSLVALLNPSTGPGMLGEGLHPTAVQQAGYARAMKGGGGNPDLAFEPEDVEISASVDARFTAG